MLPLGARFYINTFTIGDYTVSWLFEAIPVVVWSKCTQWFWTHRLKKKVGHWLLKPTRRFNHLGLNSTSFHTSPNRNEAIRAASPNRWEDFCSSKVTMSNDAIHSWLLLDLLHLPSEQSRSSKKSISSSIFRWHHESSTSTKAKFHTEFGDNLTLK